MSIHLQAIKRSSLKYDHTKSNKSEDLLTHEKSLESKENSIIYFASQAFLALVPFQEEEFTSLILIDNEGQAKKSTHQGMIGMWHCCSKVWALTWNFRRILKPEICLWWSLTGCSTLLKRSTKSTTFWTSKTLTYSVCVLPDFEPLQLGICISQSPL